MKKEKAKNEEKGGKLRRKRVKRRKTKDIETQI